MAFEEVNKTEKSGSNPPHLVISGDGDTDHYPKGYLNKAAIKEWWSNRTTAVFYVDREYSELAIEPVGQDHENGYTLTFKGGANLAVTNPLLALEVDPTNLDGSYELQLSRDGESGYIIADVSELIEAETDDVHCPECGKRCAGQKGLESHTGSAHDTPLKKLKEMDPDEIGEPTPEGDDSWKAVQEQ